MIVFIGTTRGTLRSHKTSVADLQDLRLTQNLKPCHYISFLGTLHPPIICSAKSAALVSFSCRVARSLVPSPLHSASSLGTLSPRSTNLVTAAPRPPFTPRSNPVTATSRPRFTARSRPQRHFGHVPRLRPARVTCQHLLLCGVLLAHRAP